MLDSTDRPQYRNYLFGYDAVETDGLLLRYCADIQNTLTPQNAVTLCFAAVAQNGLALEYVKVKTPRIQLKAVKQTGLAIQFCEEQTDELVDIALTQNGMALQYIENITEERCIIALASAPSALRFVPKQYLTFKVCRETLINAPASVCELADQPDELCKFLLKQDGRLIRYIRNQTEERCLLAIQQNALALTDIRIKTPAMIANALRRAPGLVAILDAPCPAWALFATAHKNMDLFPGMLVVSDAQLVKDVLLAEAEKYLPGITKL